MVDTEMTDPPVPFPATSSGASGVPHGDDGGNEERQSQTPSEAGSMNVSKHVPNVTPLVQTAGWVEPKDPNLLSWSDYMHHANHRALAGRQDDILRLILAQQVGGGKIRTRQGSASSAGTEDEDGMRVAQGQQDLPTNIVTVICQDNEIWNWLVEAFSAFVNANKSKNAPLTTRTKNIGKKAANLKEHIDTSLQERDAEFGAKIEELTIKDYEFLFIELSKKFREKEKKGKGRQQVVEQAGDTGDSQEAEAVHTPSRNTRSRKRPRVNFDSQEEVILASEDSHPGSERSSQPTPSRRQQAGQGGKRNVP